MQPRPTSDGPPEMKCRDCGSPMWSLGTEQFRVDGTSRLWKMFFNQWADVAGGMLPLEMAVCPVCRRVELWVPPGFASGGSEGGRGLRYACPGCGGDVYRGETSCPTCGHALVPS